MEDRTSKEKITIQPNVKREVLLEHLKAGNRLEFVIPIGYKPSNSNLTPQQDMYLTRVVGMGVEKDFSREDANIAIRAGLTGDNWHKLQDRNRRGEGKAKYDSRLSIRENTINEIRAEYGNTTEGNATAPVAKTNEIALSVFDERIGAERASLVASLEENIDSPQALPSTEAMLTEANDKVLKLKREYEPPEIPLAEVAEGIQLSRDYLAKSNSDTIGAEPETEKTNTEPGAAEEWNAEKEKDLERIEAIEKDMEQNPFKYHLLDQFSEETIEAIFKKSAEELSVEDINSIMGETGKYLKYNLGYTDGITSCSNGFYAIQREVGRWDLMSPRGEKIATSDMITIGKLLTNGAKKYQGEQIALFERQSEKK